MRFQKAALAFLIFLVGAFALAGDNALQNPSFENKEAWTTLKGHISFKPDDETQPRTGGMVGFVGGWSGANGEYLNQSTLLRIKPGKTYTLSAWFAPRKYTDTTFGGYMLRIIAANEKGRFPVALVRSNEILDDWTEKRLVWTAPQDLTQTPEVHGLTGAPTGKTVDITNATIEVLIGKALGNGDAYYQTMIDDAKLWEGNDEPEDYDPATDPALQPRDLSITYPAESQIRADRMNLKTLNVCFPTPGKNAYDSMPLGNGETAANLWTTNDGQICFYLSRTDAWSGIGRILKIGRVRMEVTPNPFLDAGAFEQELDLETASVIIKGSNNFQARFFVDANTQAMRVKITGDQPFSVKVINDPWRLARRALTATEQHSAYPMIGGPAQYMTAEPDTVVPAQNNQLVWYHRNGMSPFPVTLQLQTLDYLLAKFKDPYLGRTFGGLIQGPGLVAENNQTLTTPQATTQVELAVLTHTSQPDSADAWVSEIRAQAGALNDDTEQAFGMHKQWWSGFWSRSHIYASGPKPDTFQASAILRDAQSSLMVGTDPRGTLNFKGQIARASLFGKTCTPEEVAFMAATKNVRDLKQVEPEHFYESWDFSRLADHAVPNSGSHPGKRSELIASGTVTQAQDPDFGTVAQLDGTAHFRSKSAVLGIFTGGTLEAWIKPDATNKGGRIFDQAQPGLELGYWMDTGADGKSLRSNRYNCTDENPGVLTPGKWQHVAMVFDQEHGQVISYVDGKEVGRSTFKEVHEADPRTAPGIFHLTQGYALQRFINACAGRGNYPIKFNGSILTMDGAPVRWLATPFDEDADFRMWGPDYWFQNTRLPYWPMILAGDYDLMESFWQLYLDTLPMAKARTRHYYNHEGAYWPETMTLFGTYNSHNYGWKRPANLPDDVSHNFPIRHYYSGALELLMMMMDRYAHTEDDAFAREKILPIATAVIAFYDEHYKRDANGVLQITPAQALETYNVNHHFVNPAPPVAGLHAIVDRLLTELPSDMAANEDIERWNRFKKELPPMPYDPDLDVLLVAEKKEDGARADRYMHTRGNGECPELYPVFPYRLYALGTDGEQIGRNTLERLPGYYTGGWNQDAVHAAMLGDTDRAAAFTYWNFATWNPKSRFPGFYGPNYDWVPDQDHGGTAMNAAQRMLIQPVGDKIHLLPAWPKEWDVDFKLHAPGNTVVEMTVTNGKLVSLETTPASRRADCILPDWLGGPRASYVAPENQPRAPKASAPPVEKTVKAIPGPDLYFGPKELDAIREKVQLGRAKVVMDMVRAVAQQFRNIPTQPYDSDGPYIGRNIQAHVGVLAFVGMVDNDPVLTAKAKEILMAAVDQHNIHVYIKANTHLSVGDGAVGISIAYDWLDDQLTSAERTKVLALLADMADYLYDSSVSPSGHPYQRAHNHSVVAHNGLLHAAHLLGREDQVRYCIPWVKDFLALFQDGSGAPYEGAGYAEYGMMHAFLASDLLARHYNTDLYAQTEGLQGLPRYMLQLMQPWNDGLIPLGQTGKSIAAASGQYYIINREKDPAALEAWMMQLGEKGIPGLAEEGHPSHKSMYPFLVVWTDNSIGTIGPEKTGEPIFSQFNRGIVSARTAWGDPDAGLVTFVSMRLPHLGIWDHPDENSYTFTAFGDNFIIDPGPHTYNQQGSHSQILLDGTGPNFAGPGHRTQGHMRKAEDRGESVYMVADAADAYRNDSYDKPNGLKVDKVLRRILFVRASRPFVVVVDDFVMTDGQPHDFTLRHIFASNASHDYNKVEMDGSKARIIGGRSGAVATLHYLQPSNLTLSQNTVSGTNGKSCTALDASGARGQSVHFRTVVTSAPKGEQAASVSMTGDMITVRFADGASWQVMVSDQNITALPK